jgi:hypothetical protein
MFYEGSTPCDYDSDFVRRIKDVMDSNQRETEMYEQDDITESEMSIINLLEAMFKVEH